MDAGASTTGCLFAAALAACAALCSACWLDLDFEKKRDGAVDAEDARDFDAEGERPDTDSLDPIVEPGEPDAEDAEMEEVFPCSRVPGALPMHCLSPVATSSPSRCTIDLPSHPGGAACLGCEAEIGLVVLDHADFGDETGTCNTGGWAFVSGYQCRNGYETGDCNPHGPPVRCCDDLDSACTELEDNFVLKTDKGTNCGGGSEEWRLEQTFDTRSLESLELVFRLGVNGVTTDDYFFVHLEDASHEEFLVCADGYLAASHLSVRGRDKLYFFRFALPTWAVNNPAVTVTVGANSNADGSIIYLDDLSVRGWTTLCPRTYQVVFEEDFSGCPTVIPDGWKEWNVDGEPSCPGFACTGGTGDPYGAAAHGNEWTMEHAVDATELDGDVTLCFDLGDDVAGEEEAILVEFSNDGGEAWRTAWRQSGDMTVDGECARICIVISNMDPEVRRNPDVRIRITLHSSENPVTVDDIQVRGAVFCDAGTSVALGEIEETSPGVYEFQVRDEAERRIEPLVTCTWTGEESAVSGMDEIHFIPAP